MRIKNFKIVFVHISSKKNFMLILFDFSLIFLLFLLVFCTVMFTSDKNTFLLTLGFLYFWKNISSESKFASSFQFLEIYFGFSSNITVCLLQIRVHSSGFSTSQKLNPNIGSSWIFSSFKFEKMILNLSLSLYFHVIQVATLKDNEKWFFGKTFYHLLYNVQKFLRYWFHFFFSRLFFFNLFALKMTSLFFSIFLH
jgi:hypothetical protein